MRFVLTSVKDAEECRRRRTFYADTANKSSPLPGPYVNTFPRQISNSTPSKRPISAVAGGPSPAQLGHAATTPTNIAPKRPRTDIVPDSHILPEIFRTVYADPAMAAAANGSNGNQAPPPDPNNLPPLDRRKVSSLVRSLAGTTKTLSEMASYLADISPQNKVLAKASETVVEIVSLLSQEMQH